MNDIQELIAEARRTFRVAGSDLLLDLADALEALNKENEALTETVKGRAEWGVRVGTWPPETHMSLEAARFRVSHPLYVFKAYEHALVTRRTYSTPWVE